MARSPRGSGADPAPSTATTWSAVVTAMVNRVEAALRRIAYDLDSRQVGWALIGGFAVSTRAVPRR